MSWSDTRWNRVPLTQENMRESFKRAYKDGISIINEALENSTRKKNDRNKKIEDARLKLGLKPSKTFGEEKKPLKLFHSERFSYMGLYSDSNYLMHYGRKGMKRGRNIFNPNYDPIGEVAKGAQSVPRTTTNTNMNTSDGGSGGNRNVAPKYNAFDYGVSLNTGIPNPKMARNIGQKVSKANETVGEAVKDKYGENLISRGKAAGKEYAQKKSGLE